MAEAFARALGEDVMLAFSAGIWPAESISSAARAVMAEGATPLFPDQAPKRLADFDLSGFDVIVNLSACKFTLDPGLLLKTCVLEPCVPAPVAGDLDTHRDVRDRVEKFVRFLAEHFRRAREWSVGVAVTSGAAHQTMPSPPPAAAPPPDLSMHAAS